MTKRFFYVSLGVLALALAWHLGARSARADWDSSAIGPVCGGAGRTFFSHSGEAYYLENDGTWHAAPTLDLPVPGAEIQIMEWIDINHEYVLITHGGEVWTGSNGWDQADSFPGPGTATEKTSWGGVKRQFKK